MGDDMCLDCLPLVDECGAAFDLIRSLGLPMGVWRVPSAAELGDVSLTPLVMLAVYSRADIDAARALLRDTPTLVLGIGTGPREGSRALGLGAVGYMHDALDAVELRDTIGESIVRAHWRRSRAAS
ncbi:MAG: hypothetical protein KGQ88_02215 [Chloroflexi bacterium]|nr:hypothetical protein [Chloroflexota bacterium]